MPSGDTWRRVRGIAEASGLRRNKVINGQWAFSRLYVALCAMEFLEGETLRERVARSLSPGPSLQGRGELKSLEDLPSPEGRGWLARPGERVVRTALRVDELLELAIQIADGPAQRRRDHVMPRGA